MQSLQRHTLLAPTGSEQLCTVKMCTGQNKAIWCINVMMFHCKALLLALIVSYERCRAGQCAQSNLKATFCNVLQCFTMFHKVSQCFTLFFNVLQCFAMFGNVLQCFTMFCNVLQCFTMFCNVLQCFAMFFNVLQCFSMFCNVLQCFAMF